MNDARGGKDGSQATIGIATASKCARALGPLRQGRKRTSAHGSRLDLREGQNDRSWSTFEQMFSTSHGRFLRMAYGILQNKEDAEDAVQDALLSSYVHLRGFKGRSALKTWFTRVVLNAALMIRRKRKPLRVESTPEWAAEEGGFSMEAIPSPEPDPEMSYAKVESVGAMRAMIASLRPPLRQALTMCCLQEIPVRQARTSLGVPTATIKARLFRARHQLISQAKRTLSDRSSRATHGLRSNIVIAASDLP